MEKSGRLLDVRAQRVLLVTILIGSLGAIALLWQKHKSQSADEHPARSTSTPAPVDGTPDADMGNVGSKSQGSLPPEGKHSLPLPPLDAPAATILEELRRRARAGDTRAACRLYAELAACDMARDQLERSQRQLKYAENERGKPTETGPIKLETLGFSKDIDAAIRDAERALQESIRCEGVPPSTPREKLQWLRAAALGGHLQSIGNYLSGWEFRPGHQLENLELLTAYEQEAEAMAWRSAASGDFVAHHMLLDGLLPQEPGARSLFAQAMRVDPVKAYAMAIRYRRDFPPSPLSNSFDRRIAHLEGILSTEERYAAERLADSWASRWRQPTPLPGDGPSDTYDDGRGDCETGGFADVLP